MLFIEEKFVSEMVGELKAGNLRKGEMLGLEVSVLNEMNGLISETSKHFDGMMWRDGVNAGSSQFKVRFHVLFFFGVVLSPFFC
jgi:hypothetical protein